METLLQTFLAESSRRIISLREDLQALSELSSSGQIDNEIARRIFRQIHTLKGTSAAFDLENASLIAREIENLIEVVQNVNSPEIISALQEGLNELETALLSDENNVVYNFPETKIESWREIRRKHENDKIPVFEQALLPDEITGQLKTHEFKRLHQVLISEARVFVILARFSAATFAGEFRALHTTLNENGEIIATLSNILSPEPGQIGLRLLYVSEAQNLAEILERFETEILFESNPQIKTSPENKACAGQTKVKLSSVWATALLAGKKTAEAQGKQINFETSGDEIEVCGEQPQIIETALLHIIRNAVAHGIESPEERLISGKKENGLVTVQCSTKNGALALSVADDGRGIDIQRIRGIAASRGFISVESAFDFEQAIRLLFHPGFSTAPTLTSVAGRGIELDAVDTAVREAGGKIEVSSEVGRGTKFLIILPASENGKI